MCLDTNMETDDLLNILFCRKERKCVGVVGVVYSYKAMRVKRWFGSDQLQALYKFGGRVLMATMYFHFDGDGRAIGAGGQVYLIGDRYHDLVP